RRSRGVAGLAPAPRAVVGPPAESEGVRVLAGPAAEPSARGAAGDLVADEPELFTAEGDGPAPEDRTDDGDGTEPSAPEAPTDADPAEAPSDDAPEPTGADAAGRSEEHTSELQSR